MRICPTGYYMDSYAGTCIRLNSKRTPGPRLTTPPGNPSGPSAPHFQHTYGRINRQARIISSDNIRTIWATKGDHSVQVHVQCDSPSGGYSAPCEEMGYDGGPGGYSAHYNCPSCDGHAVLVT